MTDEDRINQQFRDAVEAQNVLFNGELPKPKPGAALVDWEQKALAAMQAGPSIALDQAQQRIAELEERNAQWQKVHDETHAALTKWGPDIHDLANHGHPFAIDRMREHLEAANDTITRMQRALEKAAVESSRWSPATTDLPEMEGQKVLQKLADLDPWMARTQDIEVLVKEAKTAVKAIDE